MTKDLEGFVKNLSILKKRKMVNRNSLTHKLVAIISIALVIFVIVVISILVSLKTEEIQNQTSSEIELLADLEAAHLSGHFTVMIEKCKIQAIHFQRAVETGEASREDADEMLRGLVEHDQYATSAWVVFKANKFDGKDEIFRNSERYGASGSYSSWYHSLSSEGLINESMADFEHGDWYQFLVDQEVPLFLDPYRYMLKSGKSLQFISIAFPIFNNGEFVGYTGLDIDVKFMKKMISSISFFEGDYASLLSPGGTYAIHPDTSRIGSQIKFEQYDEAALKNFKSGNKYKSVHYSKYTNKEVLDHFRPLIFKDINQIWYLQISVPSEHVENYLSTYSTNLIEISVISVLFVILLIYIVLYVLLKPVTKISNNLEDLAQNGSINASSLKVDSSDEIGVLVSSYNTLLKSMVEKEALDQEIIEARYHSDTALKLAKSGTFYIDVVNHPDKFFPSESALDILGITLPEGIHYLDLKTVGKERVKTNPKTGNYFIEMVQKTLKGEEDNPDVIYQATRADDNSKIWLRTVGKVIKNSAGEVTSVLGVVQNITEQKHSEEALIAKEENFRNLFEQSVDAIVIFRSENMDVIDCNSVAISLFGDFTKEEFLKLKPSDLSPEFQSSGEPSQAIIEIQVENAFQQGSSTFEYEFRHKNGKEINCLISMGRVVYNGESVIQTNIKDVTAYKEIEREQVLNETRLSQVIEVGRLGFYELDLASRRIEVSPLMSEIVGLECGTDSVFKAFMGNVHSDDYQLVESTLGDLEERTSEEMKHIEFRYNHPQKGVIWLDCGGNVIYRKSDGSGGRQVGYMQDITERKMHNIAIKQSEERYAFLAENINESLWRADLNLNIKYITSPIANFLGYTVEEVIQLPTEKIFSSDSFLVAANILKTKIEETTKDGHKGWKPYTIDVQLYSQSGDLVWIQLSVRIVSDSDGKPFELVGIARDISTQKIITQKLEKSELLSRIALNLSKSGSWYIDPINAPERLYTTPELLNMHGSQNQDNLGYIFIDTWRRNVLDSNPEVGKKALALFDKALHSPNVDYDALWQYTREDNGEVLWFRSVAEITRNEAGKVISVVGVTQDVTQQKLAEIEQELIIQKLKIAQETIRVGSWYIDYQKHPKAIYMDDSLKKIQGEVYEDFGTLQEWKTNIEETNGEVGKQIVKDAFQRLKNPDVDEWSTIYKYRRPSDDKIIWTKLKANFNRDNEGNLLYINGITQDVSEHKLNEQKIQEANQNLNMALKAAKMGVWKYDIVKNEIEADENTLKLYELSEEDVKESIESWFSTLHKEDINRVSELMKTTVEKQEKNYRASFRVKRKDGSYKHIISIGEFTYSEFGEPLSSNGLVWDISEIQEAQDNIQCVLDTVPVGVAIFDRSESELLFMSNTLRLIMEVEPEGGIGYAPELSYVDVEQRDAIFSEFDRVGSIYNKEVQLFRNKSKAKFWAYLSVLSFKYYDKETLLLTIQDITEMKALQMDILSAKEQAEAANVAKSAFLANMSHEIRTPMNSILGFSEILYKRIKDPVNSEYIESIRTSGQTLMGLISDILDFSKIEAGRFTLNVQPIDIHSSIQEISNIYCLQATEKGLEFNTFISDSLPQFLVVDDLRLKQILLNFLGNALKFTVDGHITIKVDSVLKSKTTCDVTFSVSDSGIGISKEDHVHIFEAFKQQEQQDNRRYGGTGLGLSISNNLVKLMGSKIQLESEKGRGSNFHFTLSDIEIVSSQEFIEVPSLVQFDGNRVVFKNSNILIVDDMVSNQQLIVDLLADRGLNCYGVSSAVEAIESVIQAPPDLIFMDIFMPKIDGYGAISRIRKVKSMQKVPIIAVTASYSKKEAERAKAHGFDGFVAKPVNEMKLLENLVKFLPYTMIPEAESDKFYALEFDIKSILDNKRSVERLKQECEGLSKQFHERQSSRVSSSLAIKIKEIGGQTDNIELEQLGSEFLCAIETFNIEKISGFREKYNQLFEQLLKY